MNKKLLCTSALVGALISGAALAELKVGGDITHTINLGSNEGSSTSNEANERLGTEMNLTLKSKADLKNGMYISYSGKLEIDNSETAANGYDHEYEIQLGQGNFYIGAGSDSGNSIAATPTLPAVGYQPGTLAVNVGTHAPSNYDGFMGRNDTTISSTYKPNEAQDSSYLSLNYKALGGTFSYAFSPNTNGDMDNDHDNVDDASGGSAYSIVYSGSPVANLKVIVGRNEQTGELDTSVNEITTDKYGVSYNFGQFAAGIERQVQSNGTDTIDGDVMNYAVTFKATDTLTIGAQYGVASDDVGSNKPDEKIKAITAGYNLGAASIALSLVDAQDLGNVQSQDSKGAVITTKFNF